MIEYFEEEKTQHSTAFVPYTYYQGIIPDYYPEATLHWHKEFEISMILEGRCSIRCGNNRFIAKKNDIIITPPNVIHSIYPYQKERVVYDIIVFHPHFLTGNCNDRLYMKLLKPIITGQSIIKAPILPEPPFGDELLATMQTLYSCAQKNAVPQNVQQDLLLKSELLQLFWLLFERKDILCPVDDMSKISEIIISVTEYMKEHFSENISLQLLADKAHLSKSYFMSCFKKITGVTVTDYLNQIRLKAVCEALLTTDKTITDIAFACGFRNIPNFNRRFKEIASCTPYEYRKIAEKNQTPSER